MMPPPLAQPAKEAAPPAVPLPYTSTLLRTHDFNGGAEFLSIAEQLSSRALPGGDPETDYEVGCIAIRLCPCLSRRTRVMSWRIVLSHGARDAQLVSKDDL